MLGLEDRARALEILAQMEYVKLTNGGGYIDQHKFKELLKVGFCSFAAFTNNDIIRALTKAELKGNDAARLLLAELAIDNLMLK